MKTWEARAAFHTLGCKVNAYETEAMEELLQTAGYDIVPFTEQADVYVVNTCSVTNMAERNKTDAAPRKKIIQRLLWWRQAAMCR